MKKSTPKKPKPVPEELKTKYDELMDRLVDSGRLTADQADKEARSKLGLSEGFKKALRRGKRGNEAALAKEIARQAFRQTVTNADAFKLGQLASEQGLTMKPPSRYQLMAAEFESQIRKLAQASANPREARAKADKAKAQVSKRELSDFYYSQLPEYTKQLDRISDIHYRSQDVKERHRQREEEKEIKRKLGITEALINLSRRGFI